MNGKCGGADDRINRIHRIPNALCSESDSLSVASEFDENSSNDIFSHSSELDYHGLHKLSHRQQVGYHTLDCIYRTFPFHRTPLQYNNRCTVSRPTMTRLHIRRKLRLDDAVSVCQFDHIVEMRQIVDVKASP